MKKNKDGYYRSTFVIGKTADGKPDRIVVRAKTKRELEEKLAEAKRLNARGVALKDLTVREWSVRWMKVYKANASDEQRNHYQAKLDYDILPSIGGFQIRDVRPSHLQELLNAYAGGKLETVKKIRIAVKQLFEDAEEEGIIERSPARRLELPETTEAPRRPLTNFERAVAFEVAKTHKRGAYVLTMLFCGLRRGECIALRVADVDFKNLRISIDKAIRTRKNTGIVKDPKSQAGFREVPIPDVLMPFLRTHCDGREPEAVLFAKEDGKAATNMACRRWWASFMRQCHILAGAKTYRNKVFVETSPFADEITPHYLRHTYATDLYAAGVDEKAQKFFLGHASSDVTDIYRKMSEAAITRARNQINDYIATMCIYPSDKRRKAASFKFCLACERRS